MIEKQITHMLDYAIGLSCWCGTNPRSADYTYTCWLSAANCADCLRRFEACERQTYDRWEAK